MSVFMAGLALNQFKSLQKRGPRRQLKGRHVPTTYKMLGTIYSNSKEGKIKAMTETRSDECFKTLERKWLLQLVFVNRS